MSRRRKSLLVINESEGEVICPTCNGSSFSQSYPGFCSKCKNRGKVYWIDKMIYKPLPPISFETKTIKDMTKTLKASWTMETAQDMKALFGLDMEREVIDIISSNMADDIDNEFVHNMRSILKKCKTNRKYKKWMKKQENQTISY